MIVSRNNSTFDKNSMQTKMSTSVQYFISGIKTETTKKSYLYALEQFRKHFKIRDYDSLLEIKPENVKKMISFLSKNRTLIIITHEHELINGMDRVIVFDNGSIISDKKVN